MTVIDTCAPSIENLVRCDMPARAVSGWEPYTDKERHLTAPPFACGASSVTWYQSILQASKPEKSIPREDLHGALRAEILGNGRTLLNGCALSFLMERPHLVKNVLDRKMEGRQISLFFWGTLYKKWSNGWLLGLSLNSEGDVCLVSRSLEGRFRPQDVAAVLASR